MLQMQSQIKVSVALMNKRVQPICAAAEREVLQYVSKKKAKQTTHRGGGMATVAPLPVSPCGTEPTGSAISLGNQRQNQLLVHLHEKDHSDLMRR